MIQTGTKYRTLIADDEQPARDRLKMLLAAYPDKIEIIGEARHGLECLEMIEQLDPDLLFLDIQMPGLNGFEVLQKASRTPVVVFCTAYDEFALQAFETNSIDYIVKPVKAERIQKAVEKLNALRQNSNKPELIRLIETFLDRVPRREISTIPLKLGDRMIFVRIEDVVWFEADEKYVTIHLRDGKTYLCDFTIKSLEEKLENTFIRIHRSLLVNISRISEISKHFNGCFLVKIDDVFHTRLQSGRGYAEQLKKISEI